MTNVLRLPLDYAIPANIVNHNRVVADNGRPMRSEENRLQSFKNWPLSFIQPRELAANGFYYTQIQDVVRCAFCNLEISKWERGDIPKNDHMKYSPICPLLNNQECGNIKMDHSEGLECDSSAANIQPGEDTCGKFGIKLCPNAYPESRRSLSKLGININQSPKFPNYVTYEQRFKTYLHWPISMKQKPAEMAEAGFFYTGESDRTICFFCGNGLNFWEPNDDPWDQHAKWNPNCSYLRLHKSPEFIANASNDSNASGEQAEAADVSVPTTSSDSTTAEALKDKCNVAELKPTKEIADETKLCKVCLAQEIGVAFLPCGHLVCCVSCAPGQSKCPICRQTLKATLKTFFT
ncbi:PREDICTED: putative inhibitor of apoptosis [Nicrophorus vespilloides]|uniref:Inhibitor of apoptosis n=1 Tax=Nicrophorus vespilloides TaxID=110193 RepID=A0ABM1NCL7_NICVS|nr:PREDICTED: putative inhibitor of apoptosis [Nicrophorus vespilloides]XP_017784567.1 PREDICTED: putative inhibitor of apoptosis [Nicrophorus vespilloides]